MDDYTLFLLVIGVALLGAAWLPHILRRRTLSFPIVYVAFGVLLYAVDLDLPRVNPIRHSEVAEKLTELTVLVALLGAGIRIDTRFSWRGWGTTWRLLGIAMPLTILGCVLVGQHVLGYTLAAAALLGAVIAPTDPVLASDIQVGAPGEGKEDPVRFGLTSEAGLNDALAFPFVWLAIALSLAASPMAVDWAHWFTVDVLWRLLGALGVGWAIGYGLMHVLFRIEHEDSLCESSDGLTALAIILIVYGVAEAMHTYGFLAVFVAAVVIRQYEREHAYHKTLNLFAEQVERMLMALLLIAFGGALVNGLFDELGWREWAAAIAIVVVLRPLTAWVSLLGTGLDRRERLVISVFGVRGIGSFYYLAFAANHGEFDELQSLWAVVSLVVVMSIVLHGLSAKPVMKRLDLWRNRCWTYVTRRPWGGEASGTTCRPAPGDD